YFNDSPSAELPNNPDISEPRQEKEKRFNKTDPLANRPALAFAYHMPQRNTPEYYAMGLLDQILLQGEDSMLYQALVKRAGVTGDINGGINALGNMFNYNGPMLWMASLFHDATTSPDSILSVVDEVVAKVQTDKIAQSTIDRALVKLRSSLYDNLGGFFGFGRADLLACFALFDDNPQRINSLEDHFREVTPELILQTANKYLRASNRTILTLEPKSGT
ncbi:MAG: M16 family metallopeptidase, partial [bacterium]